MKTPAWGKAVVQVIVSKDHGPLAGTYKRTVWVGINGHIYRDTPAKEEMNVWGEDKKTIFEVTNYNAWLEGCQTGVRRII